MPAKDPEKRAAYMREWREKNPDKVLTNQKRYEERNQEKIQEYRREYYKKNREQILAREADRYRELPEVRARKSEASKRWMQENPEEFRRRQRKSWAKRKYGLELEEYESIIARGCAICGMKEDPDREDRRKYRLCLDHDHTNGKIRDALCKNCNAGIGSLGDDPARLRAAARYIESHHGDA